jgi:hypothetical protein
MLCCKCQSRLSLNLEKLKLMNKYTSAEVQRDNSAYIHPCSCART